MEFDFESEKPLFIQVAEQIEDAVFTGAFPEETQLPSTTEISVQYKINPATVLKGMNLLTGDGIVYKKRGIGIFVAAGARERVRQKRQTEFSKHYVGPLVLEAEKLGLSREEIVGLIEKEYEHYDNG